MLGIPFEVVNFIDFYHENVVQPMIEGYRSGITPNPDVACNRRMKFGALLDHARERDFEALATGHYCRRFVSPDGIPQLWEGKDKNKDQSYFLARILPEQLAMARFPLGALDKVTVRGIAKRLDLPVAEKKDSQGICFLGKVKVAEFLEGFVKDAPGEIVTVNGRVLGTHRGLHRYTLGQRKGIGVPSNADNENFVVVGKGLEQNRLIVAFEGPDTPGLWGRRFVVNELSYVSGPCADEACRHDRLISVWVPTGRHFWSLLHADVRGASQAPVLRRSHEAGHWLFHPQQVPRVPRDGTLASIELYIEALSAYLRDLCNFK